MECDTLEPVSHPGQLALTGLIWTLLTAYSGDHGAFCVASYNSQIGSPRDTYSGMITVGQVISWPLPRLFNAVTEQV